VNRRATSKPKRTVSSEPQARTYQQRDDFSFCINGQAASSHPGTEKAHRGTGWHIADRSSLHLLEKYSFIEVPAQNPAELCRDGRAS